MTPLHAKLTIRDIREGLRAVLSDSARREQNLEALGRAEPKSSDPESSRVALLLWLFTSEIRECVARIREGGRYSFEELRSDSARAHRKAAAIQDLLAYLGYYLGPVTSRTRGFYGGPPGHPVKLSLSKANSLRARRSRTKKLLTGDVGRLESWTRDAARRLQAFLGSQHLPPRLVPAGGCLRFPDGLFGDRTLRGLQEVLARAGPPH